MNIRRHLRRLLAVPAMFVMIVAVIGVVRAGQYTYRWFAYREERTQLEAMRDRLVDAGAAVVKLDLRADTMRTAVDDADRRLDALRRTLDRYGSLARDETLGPHLYESYRADLEAYNALVLERNSRVDDWNALVQQSREVVRRYELVADSIQELAARIGELYYPIPLPVEAAVERGVIELKWTGGDKGDGVTR